MLLPGTTYTLSLAGMVDDRNGSGSHALIAFTTGYTPGPIDYRPIDDEQWIPEAGSPRNEWQSGRGRSPWESLPPLQAAPGITALAGQVLTLNGLPLAKVTLRVNDTTTQTDDTGRFLLENISPGRAGLLMNGRSASKRGKTYGIFEAGIDITEGKTNALSYRIWMPKLDTARAVTIPSPTTSEVVITTPHIPGLELHIPPGTVIYDEGKKPVTRLSITPIPVRPPAFPTPRRSTVSCLFHDPAWRGLCKGLQQRRAERRSSGLSELYTSARGGAGRLLAL